MSQALDVREIARRMVQNKEAIYRLREALERLETDPSAFDEVDAVAAYLMDNVYEMLFLDENPGEYPAVVINTGPGSEILGWIDVGKKERYMVKEGGEVVRVA